MFDGQLRDFLCLQLIIFTSSSTKAITSANGKWSPHCKRMSMPPWLDSISISLSPSFLSWNWRRLNPSLPTYTLNPHCRKLLRRWRLMASVVVEVHYSRLGSYIYADDSDGHSYGSISGISARESLERCIAYRMNVNMVCWDQLFGSKANSCWSWVVV